ncbi:Diphthamide biosynthesis protein 2 [Gaertneriomyces sp. JEL0708]|nr:Diphthamide biosynthesis protein 2 [Gaertneriomyces sp. JEL0708]
MAELVGPSSFANDGSSAIERTVDESRPSSSSYDVSDFYEVARTAQTILHRDYNKVALQFPDHLLRDAAEVTRLLQERTGKDVFVLADTTFGSCCVDEIAAEHANAEVVVHYGRTCLSPTSRLPVIYAFGNAPINIDACATAFRKAFPDPQEPVLLIYDVEYHRSIAPFKQHLQSQGYEKLGVATVTVDASEAQTTTELRKILLPPQATLEECAIFYLGPQDLSLTNIALKFSSHQVYAYDPSQPTASLEKVPTSRMLMRRYMMVQKAKDATVIGIVVGTLGVASYLAVIDNLKRLITAAGKKPYVLAVGKPNPAKLANFPEVECFVIVACPENSLIDSKEFMQPIVTPFELEISLQKDTPWTGEYETDLRLLADRLSSRADAISAEADTNTSVDDGDLSDEEPYFSLVTGGYRKAAPLKSLDGARGSLVEGQAGTSSEVALRASETALAQFSANSLGARFLQEQRTFKGLEPSIGETAVEKASEGRSGIARGYTHEDGKAEQI